MALRSHWKSNKEEVVAENGVVTAMQPQSAEAGLAILKQGGNAVDAAVAMGFCNVVLEPYMATIGGMGYMLVHLAESGQTIGLDFNGRAPRRATPYRSPSGASSPSDVSSAPGAPVRAGRALGGSGVSNW